jgi:general secretion pathway protein A
MYESFFGFREKPFSLLPDPGFLFRSKVHQEALILLEYGLHNQAGFTVLTGEIGSGKTTLMRYLLDKLDTNFRVGLISNTHESLGQLMDWISAAFDLKASEGNKLEQHQAFVEFLIDQYARGNRTLLIIDEAQNLSLERLEELRLLSNINADKDFVLQLLLLGQPQLRDQLREPELEQFVQRVSVSYHLGRMSSEDTYKYIRHRLKVAGGQKEIFTPDACHAVFHYSKGIPRIINLICDNALLYSYAGDVQTVSGIAIDELVNSHASHLLLAFDAEERQPLDQVQEILFRQLAGDQADTAPSKSSAVAAADSPVIDASTSQAAVPPKAEVECTGRDRNMAGTTPPIDATPDGAQGAARTPNLWSSWVLRLNASKPIPPNKLGRLVAVATALVLSLLIISQFAAQDDGKFEESGFNADTAHERNEASKHSARDQSEARIDQAHEAMTTETPAAAQNAAGAANNVQPSPPSDTAAVNSPSGDSLELQHQASVNTPTLSQDNAHRVTPTTNRTPQATEQIAAESSAKEPTNAEPPDASAPRDAATSSAPNTVERTEPQQAAQHLEANTVSSEQRASETLSTLERSTTEIAPEQDQGSGQPSAPTTQNAAIDDQAASAAAAQPDWRDRLSEELDALPVSIETLNDQGLTVDLGRSVQFKDGSRRLDATSTEVLKQVANLLRNVNEIQIKVVAHTDSEGGEKVNKLLSEKRAQAIQKFLIDEGFPAERLRFEGKGEAVPKVDPKQEKELGPWINRRVEIEVTKIPTADPMAR